MRKAIALLCVSAALAASPALPGASARTELLAAFDYESKPEVASPRPLAR